MDNLYVADNLDGSFKNPVLFADYSDPDVIRVNDTYYMTASSFNYIPGLPILTSKDLVNWELKNYALREIDFEDYAIPQHARGVWAPAMRFHNGRFYIYYGMPDEGIFMVSAVDPLGEWDKPVCVKRGKGLIDSCPIFDEDGKAYIVHGYAKSRIGFKSALGIFELSPDGKYAISEDHILYDGQATQPTIEGPKVYKRDGFYYILAPAGGVKKGWQTALRSRSIYGPFEEMIVLKQKDTEINGPHQGALVDTVNGDEWFIHFQDRGMYGRIIHMQPVNWIDGWPVMGDTSDCTEEDRYCGKPFMVHAKPNTGCYSETALSLQASDEFEKDSLDLIWQWTGNCKESFYSLTERKGFIRLYSDNFSGDQEPILWRSPNLLTEKLICPYFRAEIALDAEALENGGKAGLAMIGGEYAYLAIKHEDDGFYMTYGLSKEKDGVIPNGPGCKLENEINLLKLSPNEIGKIKMGLYLYEKDGAASFKFFYMQDNKEIEVEESRDFLPSDHTWVGAKIGIFAYGAKKSGFADFDYIRVNSL